MSEHRAISSQAELDEIVDWYRHALGIGHWRLQALFQDQAMTIDNHGQCETWPNHPNAIVSLQMPADHLRWADHLDDEETTVHELVHVMAQQHWVLEQQVIDHVPIKQVRRLLRAQLEQSHERLVTAVARAIVACARAERTGDAPVAGGRL